MDPLRTEEEQLDAIKNWWADNGKSTIAICVIAAVGWFGWQAWVSHKKAHSEEASAIFMQVTDAINAQNRTDVQEATARTLSKRLIDDYSNTGYGDFAALQLAKLDDSQKKYDAAEKDLTDLIASEPSEEILKIATLRLAKVQWNAGDADKALATLKSTDSGAFKSLYYELMGDIYFEKGELSEAVDHYQVALNQLRASINPNSNSARQRLNFLQLKIEGLRTKPVLKSKPVAKEEPAKTGTK